MVFGIIIAFIFGAALGSFSLVLAWRMHDKTDWVKGRSKCDHCSHELSSLDLIPIVSWLALRGKCHYCKTPISKQVLAVEVLLGSIWALSWQFWPYQLESISGYMLLAVWAVITVILSSLFWYDYRWYILPNKLVYTLLGLSLVYGVTKGFAVDYSAWSVIILPIVAAGLLSGLFFALYTFSRGKWIGFGDVRLAVPIGIILGTPLFAWMMLFIASVLGILFALPSIVSGKKKLSSKVPFGPLLILATIIVVLFGQVIIDWYVNFIGL